MKTARFKTDPRLLIGAVAAIAGVTSACFGGNVENTRTILEADSANEPRAMVEIMTDDGRIAAVPRSMNSSKDLASSRTASSSAKLRIVGSMRVSSVGAS